jgi:hypothetical protein
MTMTTTMNILKLDGDSSQRGPHQLLQAQLLNPPPPGEMWTTGKQSNGAPRSSSTRGSGSTIPNEYFASMTMRQIRNGACAVRLHLIERGGANLFTAPTSSPWFQIARRNHLHIPKFCWAKTSRKEKVQAQLEAEKIPIIEWVSFFAQYCARAHLPPPDWALDNITHVGFDTEGDLCSQPENGALSSLISFFIPGYGGYYIHRSHSSNYWRDYIRAFLSRLAHRKIQLVHCGGDDPLQLAKLTKIDGLAFIDSQPIGEFNNRIAVAEALVKKFSIDFHGMDAQHNEKAREFDTQPLTFSFCSKIELLTRPQVYYIVRDALAPLLLLPLTPASTQ